MEFWLQNVRIEQSYSKQGNFVSGTQTKNIDLQIKDGKIGKIQAHQPLKKKNVVDGKNQLILASLRDMHCHFDKSKLGVPWEPISPAKSIVERFTNEIPQLNALPVSFEKRMKNLIEIERSHGVNFFRSHIDVHPKVGQTYLLQTLECLQDYKGDFDYQLVAFAQHGLLRSQAYNEMKRALENGADLVGGVDPTVLDGDTRKSLAQTFDLASRFHVPIDLHIHERNEEGKKSFREILRLTKEAGWQNQVTLSHAFGLNDFVGDERAEFFQALADNGISVFSSVPIDGAIPPLEELRSYGVKVALGCDNVYDSWSPFGTGSILEKLNRYAELFNITSQDGLTESLQLITGKVNMGDELWLKEGDPANFILVDSSCSAEFVARQSEVTTSFYQGKQQVLQ